MKQQIRAWGLGVSVVIILIVYLSIDWIVKISIETFATEANGARVELDAAELNLWPSRIQLYGLQVTNPAEPMFNLVEAETISAEVDTLMLIRKRLIIDSAIAHGLKFNSPRQSSGDTGKGGGIGLGGFDLGGAIPRLSLPDVDQLLANEEQHLKDEVGKIEARLNKIEQRWQENIKQLPDDDKLDGYKARWKAAKKGNLLEKISAINTIKDDIDKDLKRIRSLEKQLKSDRQLVKQELANAKALPSQEAKRLMSKVGLSGDNVNFISALTGEQIKQYLQQGLALFTQISQGMAGTEENQEPQPGEDQPILFNDDNSLPQLLIKQLTLDGDIDIAGSVIRFDGKGNDFAYPPENWKNPAQLQISGHDNKDAALTIKASFDHRLPTFKDHFDLQASSIVLSQLVLADKLGLSMTLQQALANLSGLVTLSNNSIDLDFSGLFKQVKMQIASDNANSTQKIISDILSTVENFDLQLQANGSTESPVVSLSSNLDSAFKDGLSKQLKAKAGELQQRLQQKLQARLEGDLDGLNAKAGFLEQFQQQINGKQQQIKQLKKF